MEKEKLNNQSKSPKYSFTTISDYFLDEWSGVVGVGPTSLYLHLLKYCYKEKNLAWPTLKTLSKKMGVSERSLIRYRKTLVKYGFIQNIFKRNSTSRNNIYQMTLGRELNDPKRLTSMVTNCKGSSEKISPCKVTKGKFDSDKLSSCMVTICHPNNNNLNNNNITTTKKEGNDVVVVDFKKLKEKGEEKMQATHSRNEHYEEQTPYNSKEHYKGQALRERMREFDIKEGFIEKVLKEYPVNKVEEKLDLLAESRQIRNPVGWLSDALKNDYQNPDMEHSVEESPSRFRADSGLKEDDLKKEARYKTGIIKSRNDKECSANQACKESLIRKRAYHNINQNPTKDIKNQDQDHISHRISLNGVRFVLEELRSLPLTFSPTKNMGQDN